MRFIFALLLGALPAHAQDAAGNDTAGRWRVTHTAAHGIWNTICDERETGAAIEQRCYIRWVDVFSPRPKFAAQFVFVTRSDDGPQVEFGIEAGTIFKRDGFRIESKGSTTWQTRHIACLTGLSCSFRSDAAETLLAAMSGGTTFHFDFTDRHGTAQNLAWPLAGFAAARADFATQRVKRGLP